MQGYGISHHKCFSIVVEVNVDSFKIFFAQLSDFLIFHAESAGIFTPL